MDDLPAHLILEILNRLTDSTDLARCRVASKTLNALSHEVRSVGLICSFDRYSKSRSPDAKSSIPSFKFAFVGLISQLRNLESVSIGVEKPLDGVSYEDFEDETDLYLTDASFVSVWLPLVSHTLKTLSFSDFWIQSCWRRSDVLALISRDCHRLNKLEIKNTWLSVDGLNPMPALTSLTLEFVRLDDEDLEKVNICFPNLQILNLIGVGGLKQPRIHLHHLKVCHWTVSNAPLSLAILAPNLVQLKLKCVRPGSLVLKTPSLSDFHLSLEKASELEIKEPLSLNNFELVSADLYCLLSTIPLGKTVRKVRLDSPNRIEQVKGKKLSFHALFDVFPSVCSLVLDPGAYIELEASFCCLGMNDTVGMKKLEELTAYLVVEDIGRTLSFISCILIKCSNLSSLALLLPRALHPLIACKLISRCTAIRSGVRWKWGTWKDGNKDTWLFDDAR